MHKAGLSSTIQVLSRQTPKVLHTVAQGSVAVGTAPWVGDQQTYGYSEGVKQTTPTIGCVTPSA